MEADRRRRKPFVYQTMLDVAEQEMRWADYLFKDGSMIGLNARSETVRGTAQIWR